MAYFEQIKVTNTSGSPVNPATETTLLNVDTKLSTIATENTLQSVNAALNTGELLQAIEALRMSVNSLTRTVGMMTFTTTGTVRINVDSIGGSTGLPSLLALGTSFYSTNSLMQDFGHFSADNLRRNITVS